MSAVLIKSSNRWKDTMQTLLPGFGIFTWGEDEFDPAEIEYAIVWDPPLGFFDELINLKAVASIGAGVSHILKDPNFPKHVPIIRTVSDSLRRRMAEYVCLHVLRFHRRLPEIEVANKEKQWIQYIEPLAQEIKVGIMGLGNLGGFSARALTSLGYTVSGWSRRPKEIENVMSYAGNAQLEDFLSKINILVCLLPQTDLTEDILNKQVFDAMPDGSYLINAGRGENLVESDLLEALNNGKLAGATLDVFREEPLPSESPLWEHPKILITCHSASAIGPQIGAQVIAHNIQAFNRGEHVPDIVDIEQGY